MRKSRTRATTLPELMMASFLLGVVLLVSGRLAWLASRAKTSSEGQNLTFRQASIALEKLQRETMHSREIYSPFAADGDFAPVRTRPLVLRSRSALAPSTEIVAAYYRDEETRELMRFLYQPGYNPEVPASQIVSEAPRAVATELVSFQVYRVDPLLRYGAQTLRYEMILSNREARRAHRLPLSTEVRLAR